MGTVGARGNGIQFERVSVYISWIMIDQLKILGAWIFPGSLRRTAAARARKTLFENPRWARYKYDFVRGLVHRIGKHRLWFLALIAIAYGAGATTAALNFEISWGPKSPRNIADYFRDLQTLNLTILGVQASFIGLVFPIVIALADSLSSGRIGLSGRIGIFLKETEASGTAFSSVMLIVVVLAQSLFLPQLPDRVMAAITFGNILWATFNLGLIVRFLTEAIKYLQPGNRRKMINRYVANSALPKVLTSMEMRSEFVELVSSMPGDLDDEYSIFDIGRDPNAKILRAENILDVFVHDVRPRRLRRALKQFSKLTKQAVGEASFRCFFAITPGNKLRPRGHIATIVPASVVKPDLQRLLLKGFLLLDESDQPPDEFEQLMAEHASDLIQLLLDGQVSQFENVANEAIDLLVFALAIADTHSFDADLRRNWFGSRRHWLSWMLVFRQLIAEVARRARQQSAFFEHASYLGYRLQTGVPDAMLRDVFKDALWFSSFLARKLCEDIQIDVAEEKLPPDANDVRLSEVWATHIGAWEAQIRLWSNYVRKSNIDLRTTFGGYKEHFEASAVSCFLGAASGHVDTARWLADQIIKWSSAIRDVEDGGRDYLVISRSSITIAEAMVDIGQMAQNHSLRDDTPVGERTILRIALSNYSDDGRTVLLLSLIRGLKTSSALDGLILATRDLLSGQSIDAGWCGLEEPRQRTTASWLASLLRMEMSWEHQTGSYNQLMSELSERLVALREAPRISMRGYSSVGSDGVASFGVEQAELLIVAAVLSGSSRLKSIEVSNLVSSVKSQTDRDALLGRVEGLAERISELDLEHSPVSLLLANQFDQAAVDKIRSDIREELEALAAQLNQARDQAYEEAVFDDERLAQIAAWAGAGILPDTATRFPLQLFDHGGLVVAEDSDEDFVEYNLNINGMDFGSLSRPRLSTDAVNEEEWWSELLTEPVSQAVLNDVYQRLEFTQECLESPDDLWRLIERFAAANGKSPGDYVLAIPGRGHPRWLSDWSWNDDLCPRDIDIEQHPDQMQDYSMHLNDLPVFSGYVPTGMMRLMDRRSFDTLEFSMFDDGAVAVVPSRDGDDFRKASLALRLRRKVVVRALPALEIQFADDD